jgi:hypothetical protein
MTRVDADAQQAHAEGRETLALGRSSHAEGAYARATGIASHAEGTRTFISGFISGGGGGSKQYTITKASSSLSIAVGARIVVTLEGKEVEATVVSYDDSSRKLYTLDRALSVEPIPSPIEANATIIVDLVASGQAAHAEGTGSKAAGTASHGEGVETRAIGAAAHTEGHRTEAEGPYSHAEGNGTRALGSQDHAEGSGTVARGGNSHAQGYNTIAQGGASHAEGSGTVAVGPYQHVGGTYNVLDELTDKYSEKYGADKRSVFAHIVGNGKGANSRSNAYTLDWEGNAWFAGSIQAVNGIMLVSPGKKLFKLVVSDDGTLSTQEVN